MPIACSLRPRACPLLSPSKMKVSVLCISRAMDALTCARRLITQEDVWSRLSKTKCLYIFGGCACICFLLLAVSTVGGLACGVDSWWRLRMSCRREGKIHPRWGFSTCHAALLCLSGSGAPFSAEPGSRFTARSSSWRWWHSIHRSKPPPICTAREIRLQKGHSGRQQ